MTRFGAGPRSMTHALAPAAARLGGIDRIVPGHAHADPVVGDVHGRLERAAAA